MSRSKEFQEGTSAAKRGLLMTDNPYRYGIGEEFVTAYCDWLDGYTWSTMPEWIDERPSALTKQQEDAYHKFIAWLYDLEKNK